MPKVVLYNMQGKEVGDIELEDSIFGIKPNAGAVHEVVRAILAAKRQGTQSTLTRAEVRGGGIKPWRQKGSGRARHGSSRSPIWRKGGVVFAPKPRQYKLDVNRKVRRLAMKSVLSDKVISGEIIILDDLKLREAKTKEMAKVLADLGAKKKTLIIMPEKDESVVRASSNIPGVQTALATTMNVLDIINCDSFVLTKSAVEKVQEVYV